MADSILAPWTELDNPCVGEGGELTFGGQSAFILPVADRPGAFITMFDVWRPANAIDGRHLWLPIERHPPAGLRIAWRERWDLSVFDQI